MKYHFSFISLIFLSSFLLKAEISILNIEGTTSSNSCDGEITLLVTGTAGPFQIEIIETGETINAVTGEVLLIGLCAGQVTINVNPVSYSHCVSQLSALIPTNPSFVTSTENPPGMADNKGQVTSLTQEPLASNREILISPNPSRGRIQVQFDEKLPLDTKIEIFNAIGQSVFLEIIDAPLKAKAYDFTYLPAGQYYLLASPPTEPPLSANFIIN